MNYFEIFLIILILQNQKLLRPFQNKLDVNIQAIDF